MTSATRQRAGQIFAALSHPARLRIVELLCLEPHTVNSIAAEIDLSQSGTSQHLAILTRAGVLVMEPHGAARLYRVRGPRIPKMLALVEEFCDAHSLYGLPDEPHEDEGSAAPATHRSDNV